MASRLAGSEFEMTADAPVMDQDPRKGADSLISVYIWSSLHWSTSAASWGAGAGAEVLWAIRSWEIERKV